MLHISRPGEVGRECYVVFVRKRTAQLKGRLLALQLHSHLRATALVPLAQKGLALGLHMLGPLVSDIGSAIVFAEAFPDHQLKQCLLQTRPVTLIYFLCNTYQCVELFLFFPPQ